MKLLAVLLVAFCVIASGVSAQEDNVIDLTSSNFDDEIANSKVTLVEFFAPWCGHCKSLAPEYSRASGELAQRKGVSAALAKVDCTVEKDLCAKYGVKGFPTLKLFRKGASEPTPYEGGRTSDDIVSFVVKQSQPALSFLETASAVKKFAKNDKVKVVAFLSSDEHVDALKKVANNHRSEVSFAAVIDNAKVNDKYSVSGDTIRLFRTFEDDADFTGDISAESFADEFATFLKVESFPLVDWIGPENYQKFVKRGFSFVWTFINVEDDAQKGDLVENQVSPVARANRDKLSFVKLDGVKWAEHAKSFGLSGNTPALVIEDVKTRRNFVFPEDQTITQESLKKFIDDFNAGKLSPHVKSEPIPENNDGPVTVLVGKNFEDIVFDNTKDVLVEFYAPWCGHCKALTPKYEELGRTFADDSSVVIAKIDATANDSPAQVKGYPTILFYPKNGKDSPLEYPGDRTAEAMAEFIKKNAAPAASTDKKDEL